MSDATAAIGATITIEGTPIAEVGDISGPEHSTETIDVTSHDSPGGGEEMIPGLKRWGTLSFPMNSVPSDAGQQDLWANWEAYPAIPETFVVTWTDGMVETFEGFVTQIGRDAAVTDRNVQNVVIQIAEQPDITGNS